MLFGDELFFFYENFVIIVYVCICGGVLRVSACEDQCVCVWGGVVTHATVSL